MKRFARLYAELDSSTSSQARIDAITRYLAQADAADAAWAVYFLAGGKPRQSVGTKVLRELALAASGLPQWLFAESYAAVGDLAETIALLLPPPTQPSGLGLAPWIEQRLLPLRGRPAHEVLAALRGYLDQLGHDERFLLLKLISGGLRVGVSRALATRALAAVAGVAARVMAQRLIGYCDDAARPDAAAYRALIAPLEHRPEGGGTPYPFFLAHTLEQGPPPGFPAQWLVEWKYDGIRAQLVCRGGAVWIWSRGEELVTERFPEIAADAAFLGDGTVLDGELLVWEPGAAAPAPFARLQTRLNRKRVGAGLLREAPARFVAFDLLEDQGRDLRNEPQHARRILLEARLRSPAGRIEACPLVSAADWQTLATLREEARTRGVEGLVLKQRDARYGVGRTREQGVWLKWKVEPLCVDAVLVYAQRGHGRRASLYTDYTFAVWERAPRDAAQAQAAVAALAAGSAPEALAAQGLPRLVPFAKAYSGLTDAEIRAVDATIRRDTLEKFGPVRSVRPTLVFEIGFAAIQRSPRHQSGLAVRCPRILRWRRDKGPAQADTLQCLQGFL